MASKVEPSFTRTIKKVREEIHFAVELSCGHTVERTTGLGARKEPRPGDMEHCGVCAHAAGATYKADHL